jgi:hypothetical protein
MGLKSAEPRAGRKLQPSCKCGVYYYCWPVGICGTATKRAKRRIGKFAEYTKRSRIGHGKAGLKREETYGGSNFTSWRLHSPDSAAVGKSH